MPDTSDVAIPTEALAAFDTMFASAPEPTRGKSMEPGTYQAQLKDVTLATGKRNSDGSAYTRLTTHLQIVGPADYVEQHPLGTDFSPAWFISDEKSMKAVKSLLRSLGIPANTFGEALAQAQALKDSLWEIDVQHQPKKNKSGQEVPGQVYENCYFNRRLDQ